MDKKQANSIKRARTVYGLTQEALAERIGYSPDTVRAWESGARPVPVEALGLLADAMNAGDWLPAVYLREQTDIFNTLIPDFSVGRPIAEAAADYISSILDLVEEKFDRQLLRMVADGRIDKMEAPDFRHLLEAAGLVNLAYYEMRFAEGVMDDAEGW